VFRGKKLAPVDPRAVMLYGHDKIGVNFVTANEYPHRTLGWRLVVKIDWHESKQQKGEIHACHAGDCEHWAVSNPPHPPPPCRNAIAHLARYDIFQDRAPDRRTASGLSGLIRREEVLFPLRTPPDQGD
jgi:hypothetical protein